MAYPPDLPPATRTDVTVAAATHADDHNQLSAGLADVVDVLGPDPAGSYGSVGARLDDLTPPTPIVEGHAEWEDDPTVIADSAGAYVIVAGVDLALANPGPGTVWLIELNADLGLAQVGGTVTVDLRIVIDSVVIGDPLTVKLPFPSTGTPDAVVPVHKRWRVTGLAAGTRTLSVEGRRTLAGGTGGSATLRTADLFAESR